MTTLDVEEIIIPERDCRCGSRFFVARCKGEKEPRTFHKNPMCAELKTMPGIQFLAWNGVVVEPDVHAEDLQHIANDLQVTPRMRVVAPVQPTLNRRLKRRIAHVKRAQARSQPATVAKQSTVPRPQTSDGLLPCTCGHAFTQHTDEEGYGCHINECECERYTAGTAVIHQPVEEILERNSNRVVKVVYDVSNRQ